MRDVGLPRSRDCWPLDGQNIELKHQLQLQDRNAILAYKRNHGQRTQLEIYSRRGNWQTSSKSKQ